ncbi:MAG: helix-turn-helix transcriptional regulator [Planctomycetota bacterium]
MLIMADAAPPAEPVALDRQSLAEAAFELGSICGQGLPDNIGLLDTLCEEIRQRIGVCVAGVAVFEQGLGPDATLARVCAESREGATGLFGELADACPADLRISDGDHVVSLVSQFEQASLGKARALAVFRRPDGIALAIAIASDGTSSLTREQLAKASALAPLVASCWARAWVREPEWLRELTMPSRRVLRLVLEGLDDEQIADQTEMTYHAVRAHLKRIFRNADVRSRLHLMQACRRLCTESPLGDRSATTLS